jgi:hypothetical protein
MERMVTDPKITHVLIMCDKAYAEKADGKKAGVGTESQIISREVYEKVEQSKFIPIACEFSDKGEPCLPVFLRARIWIDFSSPEAANENWERLIRALYGKPAHQKPQSGKPPAYIIADPARPSTPISSKFATFRNALLNNLRGLSLYREDFLSACFEYADALRVRQALPPELVASRIVEDSTSLKTVRNSIIDWVLLEGTTSKNEEFCESLLSSLERLRELKSRAPELNPWSNAWLEGHSVFVYETFLYIIAALLKTESYSTLHEVLTSHYLRPASERHGANKFDDFGCFYGHADAAQSALAAPGRRFLSPAAELINRQADRDDLPFSRVIEAELLVLLMAMVSSDVRWYPQTLHYASQSEFPFFVRATQHRHFLKLAAITGISDASALRDAAKAGYERLAVNKWYDFAMSMHSFWEYMNIEKLDSLR